MQDLSLRNALEIVATYLAELSAGALVEAVRLSRPVGRGRRDAQEQLVLPSTPRRRRERGKREDLPEGHLRIERIEDRFRHLFTEAVRRIGPRLSDEILEILIRFLSDEALQAELVRVFLEGPDADPARSVNRLRERLNHYDLPEGGREPIEELCAAAIRGLRQTGADDPQLRSLREASRAARPGSRADSLSCERPEFNDRFICLKARMDAALRRIALSPAATEGLIGTVQAILVQRLGLSRVDTQQDDLRQRYQQFVVNTCGRVNLWGVEEPKKRTYADLERIYIALTTERRSEQTSSEGPDPRRAAREVLRGVNPRKVVLDAIERGEPPESGATRIGITEALKENQCLVIIGTPGSGKSTLLRYLALTYARDRAAERLGLDESRMPVLVRLGELNRHLTQQGGPSSPDHVLDFAAEAVTRNAPELSLSADFFRSPLQQGRCVVMLDGVDEVPKGSDRANLADLVVEFIRRFPGNRYVITSRPYGLRGAASDKLGEECADCSIQEFSDEDIHSFVHAWYEATMLSDLGDSGETVAQAKRRSDDLVRAIEAAADLRRLARTPLLLSILAGVHYRHVTLPQRRVEVYDESVKFLLGFWDRVKDRDSEASSDLAVLAGRDSDAKRDYIAPVALRFHERGIETGTREDFQDLLIEPLGPPDDLNVRKQAEEMLRVIEERSGLFQEVQPGQYRFCHLTFQEYLAAWCLGEGEDTFEPIADRIGDDWWRQVVLLEASHLSKSRLNTFIEKMLNPELGARADQATRLVWAALCLVDCTAEKVDWRLWRRVRNELVNTLGDEASSVPLSLRVEAGNALGQMGDTRLDEMIAIPAGEFLMGTREEEVEKIKTMVKRGSPWPDELFGYEVPQRTVYLDGYEIDRYPVTNAQYKEFVDDKGHGPPSHWHGTDYPSEKANHPVVRVSWDDANAYAKWAGKRLPTEAEWEKAARSTDGRFWPWGNEWDQDRCNCGEIEVGGTTPVGVFPKGRSDYRVEDMAGNVWEWCADWFAEDAYRTGETRNPTGPKSGKSRVVRGGAFLEFFDRRHVRCACRGRNSPVFGFGSIAGFRCAR